MNKRKEFNFPNVVGAPAMGNTGIRILESLRSPEQRPQERTTAPTPRPKSVDRLDTENYARKMQVYNKKLYAKYQEIAARSGVGVYKLIELAMEDYAFSKGWIKEKAVLKL